MAGALAALEPAPWGPQAHCTTPRPARARTRNHARPRIALPTRSLLHEAGVPFVAGWRSIVADAAAPFFTRGFLAALQGGKDYAEVYELGKLEVESQTEGPEPLLRNLSLIHI